MKNIRAYMHFNSFNGLQWYCLHLGRSQEECLVGVEGASRGLTGKEKQEEKQQDKKEDKKKEVKEDKKKEAKEDKKK